MPGSGPLTAKLVMVGEAPGREEERLGVPFVGRAGEQQRQLWVELQIDSANVRIENVIETRPDENRLERVASPAIARWQTDLHARLARLTGPIVVVPTGNLAFNTLRRAPLRRNKKREIIYPDKIGNWRGSICEYTMLDGRRVKMIPTLHPAATLYAPGNYVAWRADWKRIGKDLAFPERRLTPVRVRVVKTVAMALRLLNIVERAPADARLAIDIETPGGMVACIGFSLVPGEAWVVITHPSIWPEGAHKLVWQVVHRLCAARCQKVFHFGTFDTYVLRRLCGVWVRNWWWDTHGLHHCRDAADRHSLAYCVSRDLRAEFWKDEAKESDGGYGSTKRWTRNLDQLAHYCGLDVGYTRWLAEKYIRRVERHDQEGFYHQHYRRRMWAAVDLALTGCPVDRKWQKEQFDAETAQVARLATAIEHEAGAKLVAAKGLSSKRVVAYFYGTLKCKVYRKRGTGKPTADELHIRKLMIKYRKARPVGGLILDFRRHQKVREFLEPKRVDRDGRYRSAYTLTPKNGRLASSANPLGTGSNGQNQDHAVLAMFVAPKGRVMCELDMSQIEARMVDGMSGDPTALIEARSDPREVDQHRETAAAVFGVKLEDVTDEQRELGKRTRHALNYDMEPPRMAEVALVETEGRLVLDVGECRELQEEMRKVKPWIQGKYHPWVREQIIEQRMLVNSWGRELRFPHLELTKQTYKEGYAFLAASDAADLLDRRGFVPLSEKIRRKAVDVELHFQVHDALRFSARPRELWRVAQWLVGRLSAPRTYNGAGGMWTLEAPVGVKVGGRLGKGNMQEWKGLPEEEEFVAVARRALKGVG